MCQIHQTYTVCTCKRVNCPQKNGGILTSPTDTTNIEVMYHIMYTRVDRAESKPCNLRRDRLADEGCANSITGSCTVVYSRFLCEKCRTDGLCWS